MSGKERTRCGAARKMAQNAAKGFRLSLFLGFLGLSACAFPARSAAVAQDLVPCLDVTVKPEKHIHARLIIQKYDPATGAFSRIQIPGHIGIEPQEDGKDCYREIHTHFQDNRLHIEAAEENKPHTLRHFMNIWKEGAGLLDYGKHAISIMAYRPPREGERKGEWKYGLTPGELVFEDKMEMVITIVPMRGKSP